MSTRPGALGSSPNASFSKLGRSDSLGPAIRERGIRPARRRVGLIALALVLAASLLVAGCGDGENRKVEGPLAATLSYMPADSGLLLVAPTDLDRGPLERLDELGSGFPGWERLKRDLRAQLGQYAAFERDLRPQLGKPLAFVVGKDGKDQYAALEINDPAAMRQVLERAVARGKRERLEDYKGALITRDSRTGRRERNRDGELDVTALHESVLLAAGSEQQVREAIDRSSGSDNLAGDEAITSALAQLGEDALFRVVGDAQKLLDSAPTSDLASARSVPWIRALGDFTARGVIKDDGVEFELELATDRAPLRERDLPLAAGAERPLVHAPEAAAVVALREPDSLVRFVEAVLRATNAEQFARYQIGVDQLRDLGVDLHQDLLARIENLSIAVPSNLAATFQADLREGSASAFAVALDRSQPFLDQTIKDLAGRGHSLEASGQGQQRTYTVKRGGINVASFGVRGDALVGVIGLGELPKPVAGRPLDGTEGSLVLRADLDRLVRVPLIEDVLPRRARAILARLGELKLSIRTEIDALTARAHLKVGK